MRKLTVLLLVLSVLALARPPKEHKPPRRHPRPHIVRYQERPSLQQTFWQSKTVSFSKGGLNCRIVQSVFAKANQDGSVTITVKCLF